MTRIAGFDNNLFLAKALKVTNEDRISGPFRIDGLATVNLEQAFFGAYSPYDRRFPYRPRLHFQGTISHVSDIEQLLPYGVDTIDFDHSMKPGIAGIYEFSDAQIAKMVLLGYFRKGFKVPDILTDDSVEMFFPLKLDAWFLNPQSDGEVPALFTEIINSHTMHLNQASCGYDFVEYMEQTPIVGEEYDQDLIRDYNQYETFSDLPEDVHGLEDAKEALKQVDTASPQARALRAYVEALTRKAQFEYPDMMEKAPGSKPDPRSKYDTFADSEMSGEQVMVEPQDIDTGFSPVHEAMNDIDRPANELFDPLAGEKVSEDSLRAREVINSRKRNAINRNKIRKTLRMAQLSEQADISKSLEDMLPKQHQGSKHLDGPEL